MSNRLNSYKNSSYNSRSDAKIYQYTIYMYSLERLSIHGYNIMSVCLPVPVDVERISNRHFHMLPLLVRSHFFLTLFPFCQSVFMCVLLPLLLLCALHYAMICAEIDSILVWIDCVHKKAYISNGKNISFSRLSLVFCVCDCLTIISYVDQILRIHPFSPRLLLLLLLLYTMCVRSLFFIWCSLLCVCVCLCVHWEARRL